MSLPITGTSSNGSLRIHTRANQFKTSSNRTFQEHCRGGIKGTVDLANSALHHVGKPIPGTAALSASLSDASRNLGVGSSLDGGVPSMGSSTTTDGDMGSLQDEMLRKSQDMLEQQVRVSQITTTYGARSSMFKALYDLLKSIGANIR